MQREYLTISEFADIRGVSKSTIKRRIEDKIIKNIKTTAGPFKGQRQYMINRSELAIHQRDLFGPKRVHRSKDAEQDMPDTIFDRSEFTADIQYLRRTVDMVGKRLEAIEIGLSVESPK